MKVKFTELNSGYKGQRRVSRFTGKSRPKAIIAAALVGAFVFVYILSLVGLIPLDALFLKAKVGVSGNNDRLPLAVNTESTLYMDVIGESLIVLTTENVTVYSDNGRMIYSKPHVFAKPGLSVNGDRAVVFDRGGKGFMLLTEKEFVYEAQADYTIISAEYGGNGTYALGTKAKDATSMLTVYNKHNQVEFQWNCAYEYIASIAISKNGKFIGCAVAGAANGEMFTTVQYFGVDYKEPLNTQTVSGVAPLDLDFTRTDTLTLITDKGVYSVERRAEKYTELVSYYSSEFNSCDMSKDGRYIVTLAKYGSENVFDISLYSPKGDLKKSISADFEIKTAYLTGKYIVALAENRVVVYNLNGRMVSDIEIKGEALELLPTDDFIFVSSLDKLTRCFTYGDSTVTL
ncbi:MAG: hypothetical protein IKV44_06755 [Clostridia bacterium]|nr:hypothetical protein [Clostridia bacterium]